MPAATTGRSLLAHYLVALYGLAIMYASLQPFGRWIMPESGTPFFLFTPLPPRWTRFDVIANVVAYVPFGFFVALAQHRESAQARLSAAVAAGALLSFIMETAQMFLPPRDASTVDLLANAAGAAAGGIVAVFILRSERAGRAVTAFRNHWFLRGNVGDLGLALLVIWLAVQANPGIPLFATSRTPGAARPPPARRCGNRPTSWPRCSLPPTARCSSWASACSSPCCCGGGATSAAPCCSSSSRR